MKVKLLIVLIVGMMLGGIALSNTALHFGWVERVLEEQGNTNEG